jgi:hypothetical protein
LDENTAIFRNVENDSSNDATSRHRTLRSSAKPAVRAATDNVMDLSGSGRNPKVTGNKMPVHSQQDRQFKLKSKTEERSRNNFCRGKAISISYFECVCCSFIYPACTVQGSSDIAICGLSVCLSVCPYHIAICGLSVCLSVCPYHIAICGLSVCLSVCPYHIFPHYLINGTIFGKNIIECKICVLSFFATFI